MAIAAPLDSFPVLLARAWRWGRRIVLAAAVGVVLVAALEVVHVAELLGRIHPLLGWSVGLAVGALALGLVATAAWRYARNPRAIVPPELPSPSAGWTAAQRERYVRFAERYLRRQTRNRHLPQSSRDLVPAALAAIRAAAVESDGDGVAATASLVAAVEAQTDRVLEPLDREASRLIRRAAVDVAVVTGVTPSVLLDALITLARNLDLIARLADLYHGRPGLFGTLRIVRDVIGAAAAAGAAEIVSEHVTSTLAEMSGSFSARLLGPIGQATVNGVVTMRLGRAARLRCRSLRGSRVAWSPLDREGFRRSAGKLYAWIGDDLGPAAAATLTRWWNRRAPAADGDEGGQARDDANDARAAGSMFGRLRSRWRRRDAAPDVEPAESGALVIDPAAADDD